MACSSVAYPTTSVVVSIEESTVSANKLKYKVVLALKRKALTNVCVVCVCVCVCDLPVIAQPLVFEYAVF